MRLHRIGRCVGIVLWKRPHIELWFCFEGVAEHRHPGQRVEVIPLWGWAKFYRRAGDGYEDDVEIGPRTWRRRFTIPAGWPHWFELMRAPLVFLNVTDDGRSAADNLSYPDGA